MTLHTLIAVAVLLQANVTPGAANIAGQVRLKDGSPAAAVRVAAIPAPRENVRAAEGQNYYATQQPAAIALTDGEGRYRLGVPAGRYIIVAGLVGAGTFHPSATDIDSAAVISLDPGGSAAADVTLQTFPGARVAGRVVPPPAGGAREYAAVAGVGLGEMLEVPIRPDGVFEFGRIPPGNYLLNVVPTPPGHRSLPFRVEDRDVTGLELIRPPVRRVSGRIVVEKGPLPLSFLDFTTPQGHVGGTINPDLTFNVALDAAQHRVELTGLPVGYEIRAVRVGGRDVTRTGITVSDADISDVTIEVAVRRELPSLRGRVTGTAAAAATSVELTGPIVGSIRAAVNAGAFSIANLPPGLYRARLASDPASPAVPVVVTSTGGEVNLTATP